MAILRHSSLLLSLSSSVECSCLVRYYTRSYVGPRALRTEVDSRSCCVVRQWIHFPRHSLNDGINHEANVIIVGKHGSVCGYGLHLPKVTHSAPCSLTFFRAWISASLEEHRNVVFLGDEVVFIIFAS